MNSMYKPSSEQVRSSTSFLVPSMKEGFVARSPIEINSGMYFATCAFGGMLACGVTHTAVTPLDLIKCRLQINKSMYKGIFDGWRQVGRASGIAGLYTGGVATAIGYSLQGTGKYGFYDYFKYKYSDLLGHETAHQYRSFVYLSAAASAELLADLFLCPMEALKVKMQTSPQPFAASFRAGARKIYATEGVAGFYKGLSPLWLRQIPYTMVKFATFEKTVELIYTRVLSKPKHEYNKSQQLGVTFSAGYIAGIFCAIVSHPADTMVSKLNNVAKKDGESTAALAKKILKDLGFRGVWTGLGPRIVMIGTLTAMQWFIYDTFKVYAGLPASGAVEKPKSN